MAEAKKTAGKAVKTAAKKAPAKTAVKKSPSKATAKKVDVKASESKKAPSHKEIADLAHHYWRERGHHHGAHEQDWLRAEKELHKK